MECNDTHEAVYRDDIEAVAFAVSCVRKEGTTPASAQEAGGAPQAAPTA